MEGNGPAGAGGRVPVACAAFEDGEIVHELRTGRLFRLNRTAAEIWRDLRAGEDAGAVADRLARRYGIEPSSARADVAALAEGLGAAGVLAAAEGAASGPPGETDVREPRTRPAWSAVCRLGDVPVRVACHPASVAESVARLTARAVVEGAAATSLVLFRRGGRFVLLHDGRPVCAVANAASARWALLRQLVVLGRPRRWLALLHGAGAATPAGCLVLAGGSGSGKSTLLAGLLRAGSGFVADDILPLEAGALRVWPVPLAISVKEGSWPVVGGLFPELARAPTVRFADRRLRYLWPEPGDARPAEGSRVAAILFPRFAAGAATTLAAVDPARALFLLGAEGSLLPSDDAGMAEFLDWLARTPAFELVHGRLEEAVERAAGLAADLGRRRRPRGGARRHRAAAREPAGDARAEG